MLNFNKINYAENSNDYKCIGYDYKQASFYIPTKLYNVLTDDKYFSKDDLRKCVNYKCPIIFRSYDTIVFFAYATYNTALCRNAYALNVMCSNENRHYTPTTAKQTTQAINDLARFFDIDQKNIIITDIDKQLEYERNKYGMWLHKCKYHIGDTRHIVKELIMNFAINGACVIVNNYE